MLTGPNIILVLKLAVAAVTLILLAALIALASGRPRWHGRLNLLFSGLTLSALLGLEVITRLIDPTVFDYVQESPVLRQRMNLHLSFAIPSALLLLVMLATGLTGRTQVHRALGLLFLLVWTGTFVTGIFFLPHTAEVSGP